MTQNEFVDDVDVLLATIQAAERHSASAAYIALLKITEDPVDWAEEAWNRLVGMLTDKDNLTRTIVAQLLCNLAKSAPERMSADLDKVIDVGHDERFVTARHTLMALWKIGVIDTLRPLLLDRLERRFRNAINEKNCTLIRYDLMVDLEKLFATTGDGKVRELALSLIDAEGDEKYRKKYWTVWRGK